MSDPVTNVDIEDVLASIRRLVLQGPPAAAAPAPAPSRGRLVLTQALRVEEDAGEADPVAEGAPDLAFEAPDDASPDEAGSPVSPLIQAAVSAALLEIEAAPEAPEAPEPAAAPEAPPVLVLSAPMAVPGRATDLRGIEAALSDAAEAWEPDGSEEMDWSLGGVAESAPTPVFRHRAPGAPPAAPASDAPPPALDDARLRALITEVLRAELQGELGERMTRNIRKLVRREIFRVLETRDDE